jgi:capsular exopolysaccharide synthesis family protein
MNVNLVTFHQPTEHEAEAFRVLRTNLRFTNVDSPKKVILLSSAKQGAGKSTTISNLAITMAKYSLKTLLIDGDLRRPTIHELFDLRKNNGLTNYLVGNQEFSEFLKSVPDYPTLDILTSGIEPPEPSELLFSQKLKELITQAREDYDIILIDTPPVLGMSDTSIWATLADGIVLVIASNQSKIEEVKQAKEQLERTNVKILGTVLTKVKDNSYVDYYTKDR